MTTSPQPWHTVTNWGSGSVVKDAKGDVIAIFKDWQDAELVRDTFRTKSELIELIESALCHIEQLDGDSAKEATSKLEDCLALLK